MSDAEHLVQMANDIGNFFRSEPKREEAVAGIANHIAKFWTPRMRDKLNAYLKEHGADALDELPREALRSLSKTPAASAGPAAPASATAAAVAAAVKRPEPHGGDAG
jgi:formate dehydrogenase subunit delta